MSRSRFVTASSRCARSEIDRAQPSARNHSTPASKDAASGRIERLTENVEVGESGPSFSSDGKWVAYTAPDNTERYSMTNGRIYIRAVSDRGKPFRKLDGGFAVLDCPSREAAEEWAARIAAACRCAQEVREFMPDPKVGN